MRYLAIATAIVAAGIALLLVIGRYSAHREVPSSSRVSPATSPRIEGEVNGSAPPLAGDAPWALSALPECFRQVHAVRGSPQYVSRHLPAVPARATWRLVRTGHLVSADCSLSIANRSATVVRGDTHLRVPPDARFYVAGSRLILDRVAADGESVRMYELSSGSAPAFTR